MRASVWLKTLAVLLFFFAAAHTLGTAAPRVTRGAPEAAVFDAMQRFRFPVMGFTRSYWDFHQGFALTVTLLLLVMALSAWQLGTISKRHPREALPMAVTLLVGCIGLLILGWFFFFAAPIVTSLLSVICSATAVILLTRQKEGA